MINKYKVVMDSKDICAKGKSVEIKAVSAKNAQEIANTFNKQFISLRAIRLGDNPSTIEALNIIQIGYQEAKSMGDTEGMSRFESHFNSVSDGVRTGMNVVAFNLAKKHLPELY